MNKLWVIARKDIREAFRSRSTYIYIAIMIVLSLTYLNSYNALLNGLARQNANSATMREASQIFLNSLTYTLPLMYSILVCTIFATYSVIVDKAKRNIESLMATPLSLKQIWLGKTLAVALPSVIIGLGVAILGYVIISVFRVVPATGNFVGPDVLAIFTALILTPLLIFAVVSVVIYLQLVIGNPRIANLAFTVIFLILFFGVSLLTGSGINVSFSLIYLAFIIVCGGISYLLSRSLSKEKVLLSSKE